MSPWPGQSLCCSRKGPGSWCQAPRRSRGRSEPCRKCQEGSESQGASGTLLPREPAPSQRHRRLRWLRLRSGCCVPKVRGSFPFACSPSPRSTGSSCASVSQDMNWLRIPLDPSEPSHGPHWGVLGRRLCAHSLRPGSRDESGWHCHCLWGCADGDCPHRGPIPPCLVARTTLDAAE